VLTALQGELEHKLPKSWYKRTDKKTYRAQLAKIERRRANIRSIKSRHGCAEPKPVADLRDAYRVGKSQKAYHPLTDFVANVGNKYDPALKVCILLNFIGAACPSNCTSLELHPATPGAPPSSSKGGFPKQS
jgi:hypothetical protein